MCPLWKKLTIKLLHFKQVQPADFAAFGQRNTLDEQVPFFFLISSKIGTAADGWL